MRALLAVASVAALALGLCPAPAAEGPDLSPADHAPKKEPAYVCKKPLYGLAAFGAKAEKKVWLVLDKSKPDVPRYDVLYVDRNADGDLTGPGERFTAQGNKFDLGELTDPATGAKHREFAVTTLGGQPEPEVMLSLRWRGRYKFGGGYPEETKDGYMHFAPRPADAPVVWLYGDGPFRFQRWYGGQLPVGGSGDFKVFLGRPGRGPSSFAAAQEHILPEKEFVRATLVYRDGTGKERRLVCELKERC
jgi:hypothetical protein